MALIFCKNYEANSTCLNSIILVEYVGGGDDVKDGVYLSSQNNIADLLTFAGCTAIAKYFVSPLQGGTNCG